MLNAPQRCSSGWWCLATQGLPGRDGGADGSPARTSQRHQVQDFILETNPVAVSLVHSEHVIGKCFIFTHSSRWRALPETPGCEVSKKRGLSLTMVSLGCTYDCKDFMNWGVPDVQAEERNQSA